jgi:hypothetical protein
MARVHVVDEVTQGPTNDWHLCFQKAVWVFGEEDASVHSPGDVEQGYRFIYRRDDGSLQAARGQALISDLDQAEALIKLGRKKGWE